MTRSGLNSGRDEADMVRFLQTAHERGVNLFDTSPAYGDGRSERLLGEAAARIGRDAAERHARDTNTPAKPRAANPGGA